MILNSEQQQCVNAVNGVFVIVSGPGSGKSTVLLRRHLQMLATGIPSKDILNLTFTNAAATELVKRIGLLDAESVFRTFHSFAIQILKQERQHLPFKLKEYVLDGVVNVPVIPVAMEDFELLFQLTKTYPAIKNFRALQEQISSWKKSNVQPIQAIEEATGMEFFYAKAYEDYERKCRQDGWLDFDSVMYETVKLLESNEGVRQRHKRKYISVDECQDTDVTQFKLLQLIFEGNIWAVGDENQLIYEWRSAQAGNLTNFAKLFPGAQTLYLGENYRSTPEIISFLREIIPVDNGLASRMMTKNESGPEPTFIKYADDIQECEQVLAKITDPENTAVISRTNRQLFIFQRVCTMRSIKYKILGKKDFWQQNEIKKLLHLAKGTTDSRPATAVLSDLIRNYDLIEIYRHSGKPMETSPAENLNSIVKMAAGKGNIMEFLVYLNKLTRARKGMKGLTLSTVHQAKGREWDNVFVIGARQGVMPHDEGELQEEKRIFFVAASRAAKRLEVSYHGQMSQFYSHRASEIKTHQPEAENVGTEIQVSSGQ